MNVLNIIKKIGDKEKSIYKKEFISPIFFNTVVATRISGLIYTFKIPEIAPGWYKIRAKNKKEAVIVSEASIEDIYTYLKLLPKMRVVLLFKKNTSQILKSRKIKWTLGREFTYLAIPEKGNIFNFNPETPLPVYLCDDTVMDFDKVVVRTDGANLWFDSIDNNDPAKSSYLRKSIEELVNPDKIKFPGLSFEEKLAYAIKIILDKKFIENKKEKQIKNSIMHAGGKFINFIERSDHYSVTYDVDGNKYTSHISKDPSHWVISAGICLNGNDAVFDLKSLITVIREAQHKQVIHITNHENYNEEND